MFVKLTSFKDKFYNFIMNLKVLYRQYLSISPLDFADFAEKNRIRNYYMSWITLFLSFLTIIPFIFFSISNFSENIMQIIFFLICIIIIIFSIIISALVKNVPREKAYIFKNIPVYFVFTWGMGASVFNFYLQKNSFIGVLTFFNAVLILLCVFYVLLPPFIILVFAGICGLIPGIYKNFDLLGTLYFSFISFLLIVLSVFLRYRDKTFIMALKRQKKNLEIKTFGNFTPLYNKKVIKFSRSKSNELLAYLVYKDGSSVNTKELITVLFGERADSSRYGANLRVLIADLKHTFSQLQIQNFFIAEYNNFRINPEVVKCDYYDFLAGDLQAEKAFSGEFMNQYSWAEEKAAFLERKILK